MKPEEPHDEDEVAFLVGDPPPIYGMGQMRGYIKQAPNPFWLHVQERLDAHPGVWAMVVRNGNRGIYTRFKAGKLPFGSDLYEATVRKIDGEHNRVTVYMRRRDDSGEDAD